MVMANNFRVVTLGDSVTWGQGLLGAEKFDAMAAAALGPNAPQRLAHSGAVIGAHPVIGNTARWRGARGPAHDHRAVRHLRG
jgi:hypothetical protein